MEEKSKSKKHIDVYSMVTDRIIALLEKGAVPWKQPWDSGLPQNLISKQPYKGINVWLLMSLGYTRNFFLTAKQLKDEFNGSVKKGEKAAIVVYWNWKDVTDEDSGEEKKIPFLRYYSVFNIDQVEGIPKEAVPAFNMYGERSDTPIQICENIISSMPDRPQLQFKEQKAYYNPLLDYINMPKKKSFVSMEHFYETYFHELVHSTGHVKRLNRKELMEMAEFWGDNYSIEELIAEMGCCYLKSIAGINPPFEQNAGYIDSWLKKLRGDKHFVIYASGRAQAAVDFILSYKQREDERSEIEDEAPIQ